MRSIRNRMPSPLAPLAPLGTLLLLLALAARPARPAALARPFGSTFGRRTLHRHRNDTDSCNATEGHYFYYEEEESVGWS